MTIDTSQIAEFSRTIEISDIPEHGLHREIHASPDERRAIAQRLGLVELAELAAEFDVARWSRKGVNVTGKLTAEFTQTCVVSLDEFCLRETVPVERKFISAGQNPRSMRDLVVDPLLEDDPDPISDHKIDLGELAVETLALALDPYPRSPGAEFVAQRDNDEPKDAGGRDNPFSILAKLNPNN